MKRKMKKRKEIINYFFAIKLTIHTYTHKQRERESCKTYSSTHTLNAKKTKILFDCK